MARTIVFLVIALTIFNLSAGQDLPDLSSLTDFDFSTLGLNADLEAYLSQAGVKFSAYAALAPTEEQIAEWRETFTTEIEELRGKSVLDLITYATTVANAAVELQTQITTLVAELTTKANEAFTSYTSVLNNFYTNRNESVDISAALSDRIAAALAVEKNALVQLEAAADVLEVLYKLQKITVELNLNLVTITLLQDTGSDNNLYIEAKIAAAIFAYQAEATEEVFSRIEKRLASIDEKIEEAVNNFKDGVYTAIADIRDSWNSKKTEVIATLREGIAAFLAANSVEVTITGLDGTGNVTVTIDINIDASTSVNDTRVYIENAVKTYLLAQTVAAEDNVSVTVVKNSSSKRASGESYTATSSIGDGTSAPVDNTGSAQRVAAAFVVALAPFAALL